MDIFEALRQDHEKQRTLLEQIVETEGDSEDRRELFERLKVELQSHAKAEERSFYVPLIERDKTQKKARHSVAEHHEMDEIIEELESTEMSSPGWLAAAKRLQEKVTHHLDEEEQEVFPVADDVLSEGDKEQLAESYEQDMKEAKQEKKAQA